VAVILIAFCAIALLIAFGIKRRRDQRELEHYSITPEALNALLASHNDVLVFDVRLPLDFLTHVETLPGAIRLSPKEVHETPWLIPKDKDSVIYCTCVNDKTSRAILHRAFALGFLRIKVLRGGLEGWKAMGYRVEPYDKPFHLDTA